MQAEGLPTTQWQMGKNKIFLRGCVHEPLEDKRLRLLNSAACKIQKTWKGQRQRRKYVEIRRATQRIQQSYKAWKQRIQFIKKRRAAVVIQAHLRGMFAREVATALREAKRVEEERRRQEALEEERKKREQERLEQEAAEASLDEAERYIFVCFVIECKCWCVFCVINIRLSFACRPNSFSGLADIDKGYVSKYKKNVMDF